MTTIAADVREGVMVSDSRCTYGGTWFPSTKIYRIGAELIGIAGTGKDEGKFLKWARGSKKGPAPKLEDFEAIIMDANGLSLYTAAGSLLPLERGFHAIGSGGNVALGVMLAGHPARRAVEIACEVDAYSSGEIRVITFGGAQ